MEEFILLMLQKYPIASGLLAAIGTLRIINKPLFSFLRTYVMATESKSDDALLDKVEKSKVYQAITYILDWFGSVKVAPKK